MKQVYRGCVCVCGGGQIDLLNGREKKVEEHTLLVENITVFI